MLVNIYCQCLSGDSLCLQKKGGSIPVLEDGKSVATLRSPRGFQAQHCAPRCRNQKCKACRGIQSSRYNMTQCAISSMNMSNTSNYARTGLDAAKMWAAAYFRALWALFFWFAAPRARNQTCLFEFLRCSQTCTSSSEWSPSLFNKTSLYSIDKFITWQWYLNETPLPSCLLHHPS